jgi:hypothetical protein
MSFISSELSIYEVLLSSVIGMKQNVKLQGDQRLDIVISDDYYWGYYQ